MRKRVSTTVVAACWTVLTIVVGVDAQASMRDACSLEAPVSALSGPTIKVMTLNVAHGRKSALNQLLVTRARTHENLDEIAALLERADADIVALQEADGPSRWSGRFDHVQHLMDNTGYNCLVHGYHAQSWLYDYGTALLSRSRLGERSSQSFAPSPPTSTKGFVTSTVDWQVGGEIIALTVVSVHLDFSRNSVRESQIGEMVETLSTIDTPLIVMGDFNGQWSEQRSSVRRLAAYLGLRAYEPNESGLGTYKSIDGDRLDWVLISAELEFTDHQVLPDVVSDHQSVYAEIAYRTRIDGVGPR